MTRINQITGYKTSKDYKRLVELMKVQSVICLCKDSKFEQLGNTDYTKTNCYGGCVEIFRISCDADCYGEEDFIERCKRINVEFLEPDK